MRAAVGIFTHMGWVTAVTVVKRDDFIEVVRTDRIETGDPLDREAIEPYHVAGGFHGLDRGPAPRDPQDLIERGVKKQQRHTLGRFRRLVGDMQKLGFEITDAAILAGRGKSAATLDKVLASHAQIHIAEGNAVRHAVDGAFKQLDVRVAWLDHKSLFQTAHETLALEEDELTTKLKSIKPEIASPWRKEERLGAIAAWVSLSVGREQ
ncbi:MAG: hypothetical protein O7F71_00010 [Gammaproteobacteria bacterium]|nr:hypothetical protein [Gammaproteobacteria bacterium]